jgi:hypothetical protein
MGHDNRRLRASGPDRLLAGAVPQPSAGPGAHRSYPRGSVFFLLRWCHSETPGGTLAGILP